MMTGEASRWEWGLFQISTERGRAMRCGFFWGFWGIHKVRNGPHRVTHLPTGRQLPFEFTRRRLAQTFVGEIDGLFEWSSIPAAPDTTIDFGVFAGALR